MTKSWIAAMSEYFGKRNGESLQEWAQELRALTPKDKEELRLEMQREMKIEITPHASTAA